MTEPGAAPLVQASDVATRLARAGYDTLEKAQVEALCVDVSAVIRARKRGIDEWIDEDRLDRAVVVAVAAHVVLRALHSIESGGIPVVGRSHPEYSEQFSQAAKAGLFLDSDQLRDLTPRPAEGQGRRGAFSIMPT